MKTIILVAVVLLTVFAVSTLYNNRRARARAEVEARAAFVRDSINKERQRLADSTRIAQRERTRLGRESGARQQMRDSINRVLECQREQQRRRAQKIESVVSAC